MRNKIFSKVVVMSMALVMLFSVMFFGAGHCVMYDPRVAELQRRIEELEEENRLQAERVAFYEYRANAKLELKEFVDAKRRSASFVRIGGVVMSHLMDGLEAIGVASDRLEVNYALEEAKGKIYEVVVLFEDREWEFSDCGKFALHVWLENNEVYWEDGLVFHVMLKNLSAKDMILIGGVFATIYISDSFYRFDYRWFMQDRRVDLVNPKNSEFFEGGTMLTTVSEGALLREGVLRCGSFWCRDCHGASPPLVTAVFMIAACRGVDID